MNKEEEIKLALSDDVSPDLLEIMGTENEGENALSAAQIEASEEAIKEALKVAENQTASDIVKASELADHIATSPEFLEKTSYQLYHAIYCAAKVYNKKWFESNGYVQVWKREQNTYKFSHTPKDEFVPVTYSVWMRKYNELDVDDEVLVQYQPTPEEAIIQAAYKIGFLESVDYKSLTRRFPSKTLSELSKQSKYMNKLREILKLEEHRAQAAKKKVFPRIKDKWLQDIEREILAIKGAF